MGQWELGEVIQPPCAGIDHGGEDWSPKDGQTLSGMKYHFWWRSLFAKPWQDQIGLQPFSTSSHLLTNSILGAVVILW